MTVRGGDKLSQSLDDISSKLKKSSRVDIGFMENSTYPDGTSVPLVAAIQEYGAPNARFPIPSRPYFRTMIKQKSPEWPKAVAALLVANKFDTNKTLSQMGEAIKGQLQQSIIDMNSPPLSPVTLMVRTLIGPNGKASGLGQIYEAIRLVQNGVTPQNIAFLKNLGLSNSAEKNIARLRRKLKSKGGAAVASKPLVWTGHLLNSVSYIVK